MDEYGLVLLKDMREVLFGQRTDKFKKHNRPDLDSLSFSILYDDSSQLDPKTNTPIRESLDLVTKDENEFQMWTTLLLELVANKLDIPQSITRLELNKIQSKRSETKRSTTTSQFLEANDVSTAGWGWWGQNANGSMESENSNFRLVESLLGKHVVQISMGWAHTILLLEGGDLLCSGSRVGTGQSEKEREREK